MSDIPRDQEGRPVSTPPTADTAAALAWLKIWHPDGPWIIVEIDPNTAPRRPPATAFTDEVELEKFLNAKNGQNNLYFIPNRVSEDYFTPKLGPNGRPLTLTTPTKEEIRSLVCLQVDLDLPKTGPRAAQSPENIQWLRERIEALYPAPTVIIFSGGGLQAYWLFDTPLDAERFRDQVEQASKLIAQELGSDAVQNINRLMRLPGTINLPNAKKREAGRQPELARLLRADWERTWSITTDDVPSLRPAPEADLPPWESDEQDHYPDYDEEGGTSASNGDGSAPSAFATDRFHELTKAWQRLVVTGDTKAYDGDRSRLVMYFISYHTNKKGWSDEDVIAILINKKFKISEHVYAQGGNPEAVIRRQLTRIRKKNQESWEYNADGRPDGSSPKNVEKAFEEMGLKFHYDAFADKIWMNGRGPAVEISDAINSEIRVETYTKWGFTPRADTLQDMTVVKARRNTRHPVREYLAAVQPTWDGVERCARLLVDIAGAPDTDYVRTVTLLTLIGAVRRVRQPGCKFDTMLVLVSRQGTGKSTALRGLCPNPSWFVDNLPLDSASREIIEATEGKWIVECAELSGMKRAEMEQVKSMLSRLTDRARPAYARFAVDRPRQSVLIGTTNSMAFLMDTENRRYWPVHIKRFDLERLIAMRDQIWAEAATLESQYKGDVLLPQYLWKAAEEAQQEVEIGDAWVDIIQDALGTMDGKISNRDAMKIIQKPNGNFQQADMVRLYACMQKLGWNRSFVRLKGGQVSRGFVKGEAPHAEIYVFVDPIDKSVFCSNSPFPDTIGVPR